MKERVSAAGARVLAEIVAQHVEEAATLRNNRALLVRSPAAGLRQLARHDERIAAHLDGIRVAGNEGAALAQAAFNAMDKPDAGATFTVLTGLIEQRASGAALDLLQRLHDAAAAPCAARGAASAVGWVSAADLRGVVMPWLADGGPLARWLALSACTLHRVDPGPTLARLLADSDPRVQQRACQAAGELGRRDLIDAVSGPRGRGDSSELGFVRTRTALLLGDRGPALEHVHALALEAGPHQHQAVGLTMLFGDAERGRHVVGALAKTAAGAAQRRLVIAASGWSGDPRVVPWLVQQMADETLARLAADAFAAITGASFSAPPLERLHRAAAPPGDDPIDLDEDDALPWPAADNVQTWWATEAPRFAAGTRHLLGHPADAAQVQRVLVEGTQRQRMQAALLGTAMRPGTPLFNVAAPAWRQQRSLAA